MKAASSSRALCWGGGWHLGQSPGLPGPGSLDDEGHSDATEGAPQNHTPGAEHADDQPTALTTVISVGVV